MAVSAERSVYYQTPPQQDGRQPLIREVGVIREFAELPFSYIWRDSEIPRGDGDPVIVIPGLFRTDGDTFFLRTWLNMLNYIALSSETVFPSTNPKDDGERIADKAHKLKKDMKRRVHLVGHSLGGIVARYAAVIDPESVASVTALSSPLNGDPEVVVDSLVMGVGKFLIPLLNDRKALIEIMEELECPLDQRIRQTNIFTKQDGVVDWHACLGTDPNTMNIEVLGTHSGLIYNPQVYRHLAERLQTKSFKHAVVTSRVPSGFAA